jgi:hypothetical protein
MAECRLEVKITNLDVLVRLGEAADEMLAALYVDEETETTQVRAFRAALKRVADSVAVVNETGP